MGASCSPPPSSSSSRGTTTSGATRPALSTSSPPWPPSTASSPRRRPSPKRTHHHHSTAQQGLGLGLLHVCRQAPGRTGKKVVRSWRDAGAGGDVGVWRSERGSLKMSCHDHPRYS